MFWINWIPQPSSPERERTTLDQSASQTGSAFTELAGYANSMDSQLRKLNTKALAYGIARASGGGSCTGTGSKRASLTEQMLLLRRSVNCAAILEEAQVNGARSAAVFASQL